MYKRQGFACVQLAYKKCMPGVASYADVTPQLVQNTLEAQKKHNIAVAVLGTYVAVSYTHLDVYKRQL